MRSADFSRMSGARLLSIAAAAAAMSACGGGGGGGGGFPLLPIASAPAPAPAPAPDPQAESSAPCFNEADFREGTLLEFEAVAPGKDPAADSFRRKSVTEGREAFAGATPVAFNVGTEVSASPAFEQRIVKKEYKDLVGGNLFLYGKSTSYHSKIDDKFADDMKLPAIVPREYRGYASQVFEPPFSFPIDMKPGQVVSKESSVTKTETSNGSVVSTRTLPAKGKLSYSGREKLETPLGTFSTCKFTLKLTLGSLVGPSATKEFWLAAEGPYRGQLLKGVDPKSPMVATKMTYSPK
jgi:hypothetical protein